MIPALVTRMSRPPSSSTVRATAASTCSREVTSVWIWRPGTSSSKAEIGARHPGALGGEPRQRRLPDPAAGAGYERDLALEAFHAA